MWSFVRTAFIEPFAGRWTALVTLARDGIEESFWVNFDTEPGLPDADAAGAQLAETMNAAVPPADGAPA